MWMQITIPLLSGNYYCYIELAVSSIAVARTIASTPEKCLASSNYRRTDSPNRLTGHQQYGTGARAPSTLYEIVEIRLLSSNRPKC